MADEVSKEAGGRIAANTGLMFIGKGGGAVFNLVVMVLATRTLPVAELGALFILHAFMLLASELGTFNSWQALIRFGVPHHQSGDKTALHKLLRFTLGLDIVMALAGSIAAAGVLWFGHTLFNLDSEYLPIAMAYCLLILFRLRSSSLGILRLLDRFDLLAIQLLAQPLSRFIGVLVAIQIGGGFVVFVIVWAIAAVMEYITLWALALWQLKSHGLLSGLFSKPPTLKSPEKGLWSFCWISNIDSSIVVAKQSLPVLLAGGVLGPAYAAVFKIAQQIASILVRGTQQLDEVIYPELAKMVDAGETHRIWPLILRTGGIMVAIALVVGLVVAALGPDVLSTLLREDYGPSAQIALFLLLAASISAAYAPLLPTLYAAGKPGRALIARASGVGVLLVLFVVLARTIGPNGPGWAFVIGDSVSLVIAIAITQRTLAQQIKFDLDKTHN
ncbi:MAG: lipopolysaccharide biosynthesis protein [Hyphomonadaceae bacterium]